MTINYTPTLTQLTDQVRHALARHEEVSISKQLLATDDGARRIAEKLKVRCRYLEGGATVPRYTFRRKPFADEAPKGAREIA